VEVPAPLGAMRLRSRSATTMQHDAAPKEMIFPRRENFLCRDFRKSCNWPRGTRVKCQENLLGVFFMDADAQ